MQLNGVHIHDTFAEAWDLEVVRLLLTAISGDLALAATQQFVGAAGSSELGSRINAGIERTALPGETPDGRPGVLLACTMPPARRQDLVDELALRVVLATLAPTVALYDAMPPDVSQTVPLDLYAATSHHWRGYEDKRQAGERRLCVVPTTTGEFVYQQEVRLATAGTDGHLVCYAHTAASAVLAVAAARDALAAVDGVCPMGLGLEQVFRELEYVPALRHRVEGSKVPEGVGSILNLLMFGCSAALMRQAMGAAMRAAAQVPGLLAIGAMNFGGQFGRHQYVLRDLLAGRS